MADIDLVVDTSAMLAVLLNEPTRPRLVAASAGAMLVAAPSIRWEIGNALVAGVRGGRIAPRDVEQAWDSFERVPIKFADVDVRRALGLALQLRLYAYDAYVLETARAEGLPLLTLDQAMVRGATRIGVPLVELGQ